MLTSRRLASRDNEPGAPDQPARPGRGTGPRQHGDEQNGPDRIRRGRPAPSLDARPTFEFRSNPAAARHRPRSAAAQGDARPAEKRVRSTTLTHQAEPSLNAGSLPSPMNANTFWRFTPSSPATSDTLRSEPISTAQL